MGYVIALIVVALLVAVAAVYLYRKHQDHIDPLIEKVEDKLKKD